MLATRIIPCLDVEDGRVVKGIKFKDIKDAGDPVELARLYNEQKADELVFLDIGASHRSRSIIIDIVERVSREVFIPLTVGGGIWSIDDIRKILRAGADKAAVCTAALKNPYLLTGGAERFCSQCIVLSIDAKRTGDSWHAYINGGRIDYGKDVLEWAQEGEERGDGEILLNSIDMDGIKQGYDIELTKAVMESVRIPVIASGGTGNLRQLYDVINMTGVKTVLLVSLLHYKEFTIQNIKKYLKNKGVTIR